MMDKSTAQPFSVVRPEIEDNNGVLPIDCFSTAVKDYIRAVADAYGCHQDFVSAACLCTAGVAAGKKIELVVNPYSNYPSDYFVLVGRPSMNKTSPLKEVTNVLREFDVEEEKKFKLSRKSGETDDLHFHQLVIGNCTPEARNIVLAQGHMILVLADEILSFLNSFGRYANGSGAASSEISDILSIWTHVDVVINRKTEETKIIKQPAMSIIGGIQPERLEKYFGGKDLIDNGFTQRFLFLAPPRPDFHPRKWRKPLTPEKKESWKNIIKRLYSMEPSMIILSDEALESYNSYADANDNAALKDDNIYLEEVRLKMNIHCLKLAIMAHLLSEEWQNTTISPGIMNFAIRISDYFFEQQKKISQHLFDGGWGAHTKANLIRTISKKFKIKSQNSLADALGVSQQYINGILKE